jgi:hypothetical protein
MNRGRTFTKDEIEALRDAKEWPADGPTSAPGASAAKKPKRK